MPAALPFTAPFRNGSRHSGALDGRLAEITEQVHSKQADAKQARMRFNAARKALADAPISDTAALAAAERAGVEYDTIVEEVEALEHTRDSVLALSGPGRRHTYVGQRSAHDGPQQPGEWLHGEVQRMAETYALGFGAGLGAAVTPVDQPDAFFDLLAPKSVGLASGFSVLPTSRGEVHVPRITEDSLANWTAEGQPITESEPDGDTVIARPKKLAGLTMINNEVLKDSTPQALAISEYSLLRSMSLKLDLGSSPEPASRPSRSASGNTPGIQVQDMGVAGAAIEDLDPFVDAIAALEAANAEATAIVLSPRSWKAIMHLRESTDSLKPLIDPGGNGTGAPRRTILGVNVYVTSQLPVNETHGAAANASSIYVYEARQIVAVRRQDAEIVVAPLAGFNTDETGVRVIARWDVVVPNPLAVVRIEGVIPA